MSVLESHWSGDDKWLRLKIRNCDTVIWNNNSYFTYLIKNLIGFLARGNFKEIGRRIVAYH